MKKRIISVLLAVVMLVEMMHILAFKTEAADEVWLWPVKGIYGIGSNYGLRDLDGNGSLEDFHKGIDINNYGSTVGNASGQPVLATKSGTIYSAVNNLADNTFVSGSFGNCVRIDHGDGTYSLYAHLKPDGMKTSGTVKQGDVIGFIGNTGTSYGAHLHFQIFTNKNDPNGSTLNPMPTNSEIKIKNVYSLPDGASVAKTTYTFDVKDNNCIKESYPSHVKINIKKTTTVKSLPCSKETDPESIDVETASKGTKYEAIGLYKNTADNLWYKVIAKNGKEGYIYAGDTEFVEQLLTNDVDITDVAKPEQIKEGSPFAVKGVVTTKYQKISRVYVWVKDVTDGTKVTGNDIKVDTDRYDLSHKDIDYNVKFDKLSAGKYTYDIGGGITTYYAKSAKEVATKETVGLWYQSTFYVVEDAECKHTSTTSVITAPTCTQKGYTTYTCKSCGYSYADNYTDMIAHSYGEWVTVTQATCTASGTEERTCSACGQNEVSITGPYGHRYTDSVTPPSCTDEGYTTHVCANCGESYTDAYVDALDHSYIAEKIDATCVEYAKTRYTCTRCGDSYVDSVGDGYSEWSEAKPNGVDESLIESRDEYRYRTKEFSASDSPLDDSWTLNYTTTQWGEYGPWSEWSDTAVEANDATQVETRTVYKYYYYKCSSCGEHMHGWNITCPTWAGGCGKTKINSGDYVEIWSTTSYDDASFKDFYGTGKYYTTINGERVFRHSEQKQKTQYRYSTRQQETVYHYYRWSEWTDWTTVKITDLVNQECETRTVYRYVEAELGDHSYISAVVSPTCTAQGYTTHVCQTCGHSYTDSYTSPAPHSYGEWSTALEATCTEDGVEMCICINCGEAAERTLDAFGHSYTSQSILPTCTSEGYTLHVCERCGDCNTDCYVPMLNHDFDSVVTQTPTVGAMGELTATCRSCGHTESVAMPVLNDTDYFYEVVKNPSAEDNGIGRYTLKSPEYGEISIDILLDKLVILGDVNDDGTVGISDLMRLANHFAKGVAINEANADVNADGKVTIADLMRLANFFAGKAQLG